MSRSPSVVHGQRSPDLSPAGPVTPVEVFFDLVFVFTLTQLSRVLSDELTLASVGRVLLMFAVLWWMYGGYAWLTNHVPPRAVSHKLLLLVGMAGFLIAAIGIPHAFSGAGVVFGIGYLVVISVHLLLFMQSNARAGVARLAPFNVGGALIVLAAGFCAPPLSYGLWAAALMFMILVPYALPRASWVGEAGSFHIQASHFVERHGLLVMIALGESVIAIGAAADIRRFDAAMLAVVVLALALPTALWWTYFLDALTAEHALDRAEGAARSRLATRAFFFGYIPILLGIVIAAAGMHAVIAHPMERPSRESALALAGGVALFLLGVADVRRALHVRSPFGRMITAAVVLATVPIALVTTGWWQLLAIVAVVVGMLAEDAQHH